jgi:hypothetical protein
VGKGPRRRCNLHGYQRHEQVGEEYVTVCGDSGMLATENCPNPVLRAYPVGQAPTEHCSLHGARGVERHSTPGVATSKPPAPAKPAPPAEPALTAPATRPPANLPPPVLPTEE